MNAKKGYYCLIQFCPDASRAEAVNVGVVLFCPDAKFIAARTAASNQRPVKLVGRANIDLHSIRAAKRAMERRFQMEHDAFETLEDLEKFVATRGNVLKLTTPRPVKVFDPPADLDKLFAELVGGTPRRRAEEPLEPKLDALFRKLKDEGRAELDLTVSVPVVERPLRVPYAYRNGTLNLVKPQRFPIQEGPAFGAAMRLAIEGDLLHKHGNHQGKTKLIVVASFESGSSDAGIETRIEHVFKEYNVESVSDVTIDKFVAMVEREAHP